MKISFISPISLQRQYGNLGDFNLVLAHLIPEPHEEANLYEHIMATSDIPIYLDNGLFENGESIDAVELANKAVGLKAEYVFAPDVLYNRKETEESLRDFVGIMKQINKEAGTNVKVAGVVQADNMSDYCESYEWMVKNPDISLIGLSILSIPKSFSEITSTDDIVVNRIECLKQIDSMETKKDSHLLGAGNSYGDIFYASGLCPWVKSHDSSSAIWNAIQGKRVDADTLKIEGGKADIKVDFDWDESLTVKQIADIEHNIDIVRKLTGHVW